MNKFMSKIMVPFKPFYFIRHGQTNWNLENRAMGVTDIPLNSSGEMQSRNACEQVKGLSVRTICHSPLLRAKQTAEILNETLQCDMVPIDELKEFDLGSSAGSVIGNWFDDWMRGTALPDGETFDEFMKRTLQGINKTFSYPGPTLIVAHGGTYWTLQRAMQLLDLPDLPNCTLVNFIPPKSPEAKWSCLQKNR